MPIPDAILICNRCRAEWTRPALVTLANWDNVVSVTLHMIDHVRTEHDADDEAVAMERWLMENAASLGVAPRR